MRRRWAVALVAVAVLTWATGLALDIGWGAEFEVVSWVFATVFLTFALVGGLIARRRPDNLVGWLLLAIGLVECVAESALGTYAVVGSARGWAAAGVAVGLAQVAAVGPGLGALTLLYFPTGQLLPQRRWRILAAGTVAWMVVALLSALAAAPGLVGGSVADAVSAGSPVVALVGAAGIVARSRRADVVVRQQLKWVAYAAVLLALGLAISTVGWTTALGESLPDVLFFLPFLLALLALPVAIGIAILRYQLFDIDRLVARTVSYLVLTTVTLSIYLGAVVVTQAAVSPLTAGSDLAVAVSTLAAAAAFQPVRRWVQRAVDRRFDRARYDAQRTVDRFSATVRDEVDLPGLVGDLAAVAVTTVAPRSVHVWLRPEEQTS